MIELKKRIKSPIIIEGFPGFGFISTISTEFLIKNLKVEKIGYIKSKKLVPVAAIHNSEIVEPLEIFYNKKNNLLILRALTNIDGAEWDIAESLIKLAKETKAKEIISIEGLLGTKKNKVFYFTNTNEKKFEKMGLSKLKEGIIFGVTGVLLLHSDEIPLSSIFVETDLTIPDSGAAAEVIRILDDYLELKIDYKPLIKAAEQFEEKLKTLLAQLKKTTAQKEKRDISYLG